MCLQAVGKSMMVHFFYSHRGSVVDAASPDSDTSFYTTNFECSLAIRIFHCSIQAPAVGIDASANAHTGTACSLGRCRSLGVRSPCPRCHPAAAVAFGAAAWLHPLKQGEHWRILSAGAAAKNLLPLSKMLPSNLAGLQHYLQCQHPQHCPLMGWRPLAAVATTTSRAARYLCSRRRCYRRYCTHHIRCRCWCQTPGIPSSLRRLL